MELLQAVGKISRNFPLAAAALPCPLLAVLFQSYKRTFGHLRPLAALPP